LITFRRKIYRRFSWKPVLWLLLSFWHKLFIIFLFIGRISPIQLWDLPHVVWLDTLSL
jgi:hypothetical protein